MKGDQINVGTFIRENVQVSVSNKPLSSQRNYVHQTNELREFIPYLTQMSKCLLMYRLKIIPDLDNRYIPHPKAYPDSSIRFLLLSASKIKICYNSLEIPGKFLKPVMSGKHKDSWKAFKTFSKFTHTPTHTPHSRNHSFAGIHRKPGEKPRKTLNPGMLRFLEIIEKFLERFYIQKFLGCTGKLSQDT